MKGKYVIAGIGHTAAYGKLPACTTVSMNVGAVRNALKDANIASERRLIQGFRHGNVG